MAVMAAERGFQVLVGYHNDSVFVKIKDGFYFYKDHAVCSEKRLEAQKKNGMILGVLDEEGLIYDEERYIRLRASKKLLDMIDYVFLWGGRQSKTIEKVSPIPNNKFVVGSPKFDYYFLNKKVLTFPKNRINVLVNTRFTYVHGYRRGGELDVLRDLGFFATKEDELDFLSFIEDDKKICYQFEKLIETMAFDGRFNLTVRPHPAEDIGYYQKYESLYEWVKVNNSDSLMEQLLANDVMVHDGCTTAIEARALGIPVMGLRPSGLTNPYNDYANNFSLNFESHKDLIAHLSNSKNLFDLCEGQPSVDYEASINIENWDGRSKAIDNILDLVDRAKLAEQKIIKNYFCSKFSIFEIKCFLSKKANSYKKIENILSIILPKKKMSALMSYQAIIDAKYPKVDIDVIKSEVAKISKMISFDDFSERFLVTSVSDYSFLIIKSD
jgi:surface carbohydrate biosynthesis protein